MKKLISISFALTLFLSLLSCGQKTPSDLAKSMMKDLKEANYEAIPSYYYFDEIEESKAEENKQMIVAIMKDKVGKEFDDKGGIKEFSVLSETLSEDGLKAEVEVSITFGNGGSDTNKLDFIKKGDKWYADLGK